MLLTKTRSTSWTLTLDPLPATIEVITPFNSIGKFVLDPLINCSILSMTWSSPTAHPVNSSVAISSISTWNSWKVLVRSVGIPTVPPIETVRVSLLPYPNPVFLISKSITLDPWPTTISIFAPDPLPEDDEL